VFFMAKQGQQFQNYTKEFKEKVINEKITSKHSYSYLSTKYNVPAGTIITWIYQYRQNNGEIIHKKRGRQKNDVIDYKERYEILKKFQDYVKEVERKKK